MNLTDDRDVTGNLHCRCWVDAEPCCWCLDDTVDEGLVHVDSPCPRSRSADCIEDLQDHVTEAENEMYQARAAKRAARLTEGLVAGVKAGTPDGEVVARLSGEGDGT